MTEVQFVMVETTDVMGDVESEPMFLKVDDGGLLTIDVNGVSVRCEAEQVLSTLLYLNAKREAA